MQTIVIDDFVVWAFVSLSVSQCVSCLLCLLRGRLFLLIRQVAMRPLVHYVATCVEIPRSEPQIDDSM